MISMVVCSRLDPSDTLHERNVRRCSSGPIEYLRMDNREGRGICAVYNDGVRKASGDIVAFMHEDAFFLEGGWDAVLARKFSDPGIGLVGVAGTQYLMADLPGWAAPGRPFIKGRVVHETADSFHLTVFSWEEEDSEVVAVDGLFFAMRKSLFDRIRFDETTFDRFHFYDLDICMQVRATHRLIVTPGIIIKHRSGGSFDAQWQEYASRFGRKYRDLLPASCTDGRPDLARRVPFESVDLRGRISQATIA